MASSGGENPEIFGVWKAYKSENMDALMEKAGAPWIARKAGANATPTVKVTRVDGKRIKINTKSMMWNMEEDYEIDSVVEAKFSFNGDKLAHEAEWSDGRLVCYQGPLGTDVRKKGTKYIRSLEPNGDMLMTAILDGVVAYRWFRKES